MSYGANIEVIRLNEEIAQLRTLLSDAADMISDVSLSTASYCEICERHALKNEAGSLCGPIAHTDGCIVGDIREVLARAQKPTEQKL